MTAALLALSLILHAASLYLIALLFLRYKNVLQAEERQAAMLEETEQALAACMLEMREENEKLLAALDRSFITGESSADSHDGGGVQQKELSHEEAPETPHEKDQSDQFRLDVLNLYQNGYTIEEIAKKLDKGKTEISLMLKFRQF
ncbi:DUF6115 domain-containing protein [Metabacillus sp. JX24]|uniref:DUF6115 domain-containing protein n=1 Tax=Metabacillus sp. JX24 TaxID=3240759 RepID=UPI00350FB329